MEKVVPWSRLLSVIEPDYPKGERGRTPIGLDALYDSIAMRAFAGIDLAVENAKDATTSLKFRRLLVEHDLTRTLFDEIGISLCERGLMMKEGTLVDADSGLVHSVVGAAANVSDLSQDQINHRR